VSAGYLVLYVLLFKYNAVNANRLGGLDFGLGDLVRFISNLVLSTFGTSLFNGPWRWTQQPSTYPEAASDAPTLLVALCSIAIVAVVVYTSMRRVSARRAWLVLAGCLVADLAVIGFARLSDWGPPIGLYHHYIADLAVVTALTLALVFVPTLAQLQGVQEPPRPSKATHRAARLTGGLVVLLVISAGISYGGAASAWRSNPAKEYVQNARQGMDGVREAGLLVQDVPTSVLHFLFAPLNTTEVLLSVYPDHPRFETSVDRLFFLDARGRVKPGEVVGWPALDGPVDGCGWPIDAVYDSVLLRGTPYRWPWYAALTYTASDSFLANVSLGDSVVPVEFKEGRHKVFFRLAGGGSTIKINGLPPESRLCIDEATVGSVHDAREARRRKLD
jgi:hypothetical protein